MFGIAKRLFLDKWRSLLIYIASSLSFSMMYVALYPTLREQIVHFEEIMDAFPKEILEAFGYTAEVMGFATVESLLATDMFTFIWPIILIIFAASLANHLFAGDIEKGTIEFTLSQPISRARIFLVRYLSGATLIALFVATTIYGIILQAMLMGIEYNFDSYTTMTILGLLFGLAVFSLGTFFSTMFSEKGKATFALVGVLMTMYVVNIIGGLEEDLKDIKYGTLFNYFDVGKAFVRAEYADWSLLVFSSVFVLFSLLALVRFTKRDIAV